MEAFEKIVELGKQGGKLLRESFLQQLRSLLDPNDHRFWLFLLSSCFLILLIYFAAHLRRNAEEDREGASTTGFFRFCFPRSIWSDPSAWLDVRYFFVHSTIQGALLTVLQIPITFSLAFETKAWILGRYGTPALWEWRDSTVGALLATVLLAAFIDFVQFGVHVLQHKVPFLWEFHKVHHSASALHPLSNYREHPIDNIVYQWFTTIANGVGIGVILSLFDEQPVQNILGANFVTFSYNLVGYHLRHSHLWLAWPPALGRILGSPANHQIHHSAETRHLDKNFGFTFAIWDWIFGTLYLPRERESFRTGLNDGTGPEYSSMLRLYFLPFVKIYRSSFGRFRRQTTGSPDRGDCIRSS